MNTVAHIPNPLARWLDRWQPSGWFLLGGAAVAVGLAAGFGVWVFKELILLAQAGFGYLLAQLAPLGAWTIMLAPMAGGLLVGLMAHYFIGVERYHGVAGIIESVALAGGRLRYWRMPSKTIASALSIGSGASVGPEDPSVQIGANLGSMAGQWLRFSDERTRALVAAGAAAGVSAAFNAPIAGVFFALEIILGEISGGALGVVVLASVVSAVVMQALSGPQPAFSVPAYQFQSVLELPFYLVLGLLAGPTAALYSYLLNLAQDLFHGLSVPRWVKPVIAGTIVGFVGIFLPQVMGVGYSTIEQILNGQQFALWLLLALTLAKLVCTPVSIGGGFLGGVFAPSLFIGATLGDAFGTVTAWLFPSLGITPPSFAMVGMAAVLAGAVHAPLTAIILLFEMTNDYHIILPLMFSVTVSLLLSQRLQRDSVYMIGIARKGIRIQRGRDVEVLESLTVGEVMETDVASVREVDSVDTATNLLTKMHSHGLPVVDNHGELVGIVTVQDLERDRAESNQPPTVADICTRDVLVTYQDESMGEALRRMSVRDIGRLPVVARDNPRRLVGILRRTNVIRAYDIALTRRAALRHRAQQVRLGAIGGMSVEEITIDAGALCAGRKVSEVAWPRDCVLATVRRGGRLMIPRGDTVLQAKDVLAVVAEGEALTMVEALCRESQTQP